MIVGSEEHSTTSIGEDRRGGVVTRTVAQLPQWIFPRRARLMTADPLHSLSTWHSPYLSALHCALNTESKTDDV
jgi:hypothetical protein